MSEKINAGVQEEGKMMKDVGNESICSLFLNLKLESELDSDDSSV